MRLLTILGKLLAAVVIVAVLVVCVAWLASRRSRARVYEIALQPIAIPTDSASLARGEHLAEAVVKCSACHGADYGGAQFVNDMAFGRLWGSNLTTGTGGVGSYRDVDWVRTLRHGVKPNGHTVVFMPSQEMVFGDRDLAAIIAYVKSRPPVNRQVPPPRIGPAAAVLAFFKVIPLFPADVIDHAHPDTTQPPAAVNASYGQHLARVGGCGGCHGPQLAGDAAAGGPNITRGRLGAWSDDDFIRAMRTGKRPDGTAIASAMPWALVGKMTDDELRAVWMYVRSLPAAPPKPAAAS